MSSYGCAGAVGAILLLNFYVPLRHFDLVDFSDFKSSLSKY